MDESLDIEPGQFTNVLKRAGEVIERLYQNLTSRQVYQNPTPEQVQSVFESSMPEEGMELEAVIEEVERDVVAHSTINVGPYFYGYITGGGNQAAIVGEMIKAALNQNNLKWHSSPVSTELEKLVTSWVAEFIGYPTEAGGVLLGGGSVANFESLAVARKIKAPVDISKDGLYNAPPMTVYVSEEGHSSFDKAVDMLGIGKKYLRKIPTNERFCIRVDELDKQIAQDRRQGLHPTCAIGIAGTTNTGAVDNLETMAEVCRKHDLWYHVDAAYGGPAASLDEIKPRFNGMELADSLIIDPHKWMYIPFGAACVLVKNPEHMRRTFSMIPNYLQSNKEDTGRTDLMEYNLPLTKDFKALKVWMTMKAYGAQKLRQMIRADIDKAAYLAQLIYDAGELELMAPAPLSIVCFRYHPSDITEDQLNTLNDRLIKALERDGRVFLTGTKIREQKVMRACLINHRTQRKHMDRLVKIVREVGEQVQANY